MTNLPSKVGDRYLCFVVIKRGKGWSGPYGQNWSGPVWECDQCGYRIPEYSANSGINLRRAAEHHEHGHAPCANCGQMLLRRKDGTARQHAHNKCPGKNPGYKIEREFAKNISQKEFV
jgi:predicted RNA-binding Zn-ribbon protein involved in translation (DUF1610 family)